MQSGMRKGLGAGAEVGTGSNPAEAHPRNTRDFEASPLATSITSLEDGKLIEANERFLQLFGVERKTAIGRAEIGIAAGFEDKLRQVILRELRAGRAVRTEASPFSAGQSTDTWVVGTFEPMELGGQPCVLTVLQDVTRERAATHELKLSERRFASLVRASARIVWAANVDGTPRPDVDKKIGTHSWRNFTGQTLAEVQGQGWREALHPDDIERMERDFSQAREHRTSYQTEYRLRRRDGEYRLFSVRGIPALNDDGEIDEWIGTMSDITEQRAAEVNLKQANMALWLMAEVGSAAVADLDYRGTIERIAQATVPIFAHICVVDLLEGDQLRRAAVAHRQPAPRGAVAAFHRYPPRLEDTNDDVTRVILSGEAQLIEDVAESEYLRTARNEGHLQIRRERHIQSVLRIPLFSSGKVFGAISFALYKGDHRYDESDLELAKELGRRMALSIENARLYSETREAESKFREANRFKDEFLGMVSHELRTPLTVVRGGARVLLQRGEQLEPQARRELAADMEQEAARLARMLDDLLTLSRLELQQQPDLEPVLLGRNIPELVRRHSVPATAKRTTVTVEGPIPVVMAEPGYLGHVVGNLLSNAGKYSPEDTPIEVRVECLEPDRVTVRVLDSGVGLSPAEIARVFERFYRSERTSKFISGAGMGLPVCKRLVEAMGGDIWVRQRKPRGLEVGFSLPVPAGEGEEA